MLNLYGAKIVYDDRIRRAENAALRPQIEKRSQRRTALKSLLAFIARF
jgi:hypothetical protein